MKRFKNILLLVTDVENPQQMVIGHAVSLAKQNDAQLTVITVIKEFPADLRMAVVAMHPEDILKQVVIDCNNQLDALATDAQQQGAKVNAKVLIGAAFLEIIRQVIRDKHDLLIMADEGRGSIKENVFGATSLHLMRKCPCPVWVVKPSQKGSFKRILVAVDPTEHDEKKDSLNPRILQLAASLAHDQAAELHIIHVRDVLDRRYVRRMSKQEVQELMEHKKKQDKQRMDALLNQVDISDLNPHMHLLEGDPDFRIPELTVKEDIDLLVMGTVSRTGIAGFFIGNTAEEILNQVNCSMLTLKPEGFVSPVTLEEEK